MKLGICLICLLFIGYSCNPPEQFSLHVTRSLQNGPPVPDLDWQPIDLSLVYIDDLPSSLSSEFFPRAKSWYNKVLKVINTGPITISVPTCGGLSVPDKYLNTSLDTNLLILITYSESKDTKAWAVPCEINEDSYMRPILGRIHLEGDFSSLTWEQKFALSVHQIAHILAYDFHLAPYFLGEIGERNGLNEVIGYTTRRDTQITYIKTPMVLKYSKLEFQCNNLYGLDTEQGFVETGSSIHWDKRIMNNDFMVASWDTYYIVYSKISLALFEDSGWYQVDYSYGEQTTWGSNKGCEFIIDQCIIDKQAKFSEFCNISTSITQCDHTHTYKGTCTLTDLNSPIPTQYQYFNDPYIGGNDSLADYCPYIQPLQTGSCLDIGEESSSINEDDYGESVCENCKCLEGTYVNQLSKKAIHLHAGCHKVTCEGNIAVIHIGQEIVFCDPSGGKVAVRGYDGYLFCPNSNILCKDLPCPFACYGRGKCIDGQCQCESGSFGTYCEDFGQLFTFTSIFLILTN